MLDIVLFTTLGALPMALAPAAGSSRCAQAGMEAFGATAVVIPAGTRGPKRVRYVAPKYPAREFTASMPWVGEVLVAPHGAVTRVWTVRSLGEGPLAQEFEQATIEAIREWKYRPYRVDGVATPACITLVVHFQLGRR